MAARFFRWSQEHGADPSESMRLWYLQIRLDRQVEWSLTRGQYVEKWDPGTIAFYDDDAEPTDFPITSCDIPVCSPRLVQLLKSQDVGDIQYLPLQIRDRRSGNEIVGYHIANCLQVLDCLDRGRSIYQSWTKDNLLFWQKREWMLGTFRDVRRAVLDVAKIGQERVFRLWGWEAMVIIRDDVKRAIEDAGVTGCRFGEVETSAT